MTEDALHAPGTNSSAGETRERHGVWVALLVFLTAYLIFLSWFSLSWEVQWDAKHFQYCAYLINEHDRIPYKEIHDPNVPGIFLFHAALTRVIGYEDSALRAIDLAYLALIGGVTWCLLAPLHWRYRWFGVLLYPLLYLHLGEYLTFQREHLLVLPVAVATWIITSSRLSRLVRWQRTLACGVAAGMAMCIKPQAGIVLVPLLLYDQAQQPATTRFGFLRGLATYFVVALLGASLPIAGLGLWLANIGGLESFTEIASKFWPIHTKLYWDPDPPHEWQYAEGQDAAWLRVRMLLMSSTYFHAPLFGVCLLVGIAALVGGRLTAGEPSTPSPIRRRVILWAGCALAFLFNVVVVTGQPLPYVWQPMIYYLCLLACLCSYLVFQPGLAFLPRFLAGLCVTLLILFAIWPMGSFRRQLLGLPPHKYMSDAPYAIADYLQSHAQPDDQVQLIDWFGGATYSAFEAKLDTATRFIDDYFLFFHPSHPQVQRNQEEFLQALARQPPRFVVWTLKPRNHYAHSEVDAKHARAFRKRLVDLLDQYYEEAVSDEQFKIYLRK